jgi:hypothetical protein
LRATIDSPAVMFLPLGDFDKLLLVRNILFIVVVRAPFVNDLFILPTGNVLAGGD